jgi:TPP-dependent pyruvate/acetoin dehydrogenase alpha subunit
MKQDLTRQQHLDLYYYMRLNRAVEDTMVKLFRQNKIVGGLYSSLGQEAISVGTAYALEKKDWLAPMIRNIGALLVKGVPPKARTAPATLAIWRICTSCRLFPCWAI